MGPTRVTEEAREGLLHYLRGGTFLWVAAGAVGLRPEEVQEWVAVGSQTGAAEPYRSLAREVRQAMAQAWAEAAGAARERAGSARSCVMNVRDLDGFGMSIEADAIGVNDDLKKICIGGSPGQEATGGGAAEEAARGGTGRGTAGGARTVG